jgi:serine/threonine protein kinase
LFVSQLLPLNDGDCTHLGSLDRYLFREDQMINQERKMEIVQGIARGVLHLHKHNIVHRDLAARNILLTSNGDPKISVLCCIS